LKWAWQILFVRALSEAERASLLGTEKHFTLIRPDLSTQEFQNLDIHFRIRNDTAS
jgi:hypothetical protein